MDLAVVIPSLALILGMLIMKEFNRVRVDVRAGQ
jgi:hypothetical protein